MSTSLDFLNSPWRAIPFDTFLSARKVPTMLRREEQKFYFWLARDWATCKGATVDLGCFAGGSTARLAEGFRQGGKAPRIEAYDRFTASQKVKQKYLYPKGIPKFDGLDILPLATELLSPWAPSVRLHPGEIEDTRWPGDPIELLIIDAGKTALTTDRIAQNFFPSLIAGHSLVVHQDFAHRSQPWLTAQMQALSEYFEPVARCQTATTVAFRCIATPPRHVLAETALARMDDKALIDLVLAAQVNFTGFINPRDIGAMVQLIKDNPREREAWRLRPGNQAQ